MSTEINTNQISKDIPKSPALTGTGSAQATATRQNVAADTGKSLPQAATAATQPSMEQVQEVVQQLNQHVQQINRDLLFSVDDSSGHTVIKVVNSETEEVVRQIPSEEFLRISRSLHEQMDDASGLIFETSA